MEFRIKEFLRNRHGGMYLYATNPGGERIQYNDIFHANELMRHMHDWMVDNGWAPRDDKKFPEQFYHHQFKQGGVEEVRWYWRFNRAPDADKGAGFYHYFFNVSIRIIGMKRTEIMRRDMKLGTMKGDIEVESDAYISLDHSKKWRNHWLLKNFLDTYLFRLSYNEVLAHRAFVRRETNRFMDSVKTFFKLPRFRPPTEEQASYDTNRDFE